MENSVSHKKFTVGFVLLAVALGVPYLLAFAHRFVPSAVAADMARDLHAGPALLGLLSSVYFYVYGLSQASSGMLVDKFGSRKVIFCALIVAGAGGMLFAFAPNVQIATIARFFVGLGAAPMLIAALTLLSRVLPKDNLSSYYSIVYFIGGLGPLIAASPMAYLSSHFGWRGACAAIAGFTLLYAAVIFLLVGKKYDIKATPIQGPVEKNGSSIKTILTNKEFWAIVLFGFGVPSVYLVVGGLWLGHYLREVHMYTAQETGAILSFGAIGSIIGFVTGPFLSDKVFHSRRIVLVLFGTVTSCALLPFVLGLKLPFYMIAIQTLMMGIFGSGSQPVTILAVKDIFSKSVTGTAMGLYNTFPLIGAGMFQMLAGVLLAHFLTTGTIEMAYRYAFTPTFVFCIIGTLCGLFVTKKHQ